MRTIIMILTIILSSCTYKNRPAENRFINVVTDNGLMYLNLDGRRVEAVPSELPIVVCISETHRQLKQEVLQVTSQAAQHWNNWLDCEVIRVNSTKSSQASCDVTVRTENLGPVTPVRANVGRSRMYGHKGIRFVDAELRLNHWLTRNMERAEAAVIREFGHLLGLAGDPGRPLAQIDSAMAELLPLRPMLTRHDKELLSSRLTCGEEN